MHGNEIITGGLPLEEAEKVMILLHGRGASPENIMGLAPHLNLDGFALLAPRAVNGTWYPHSFLAPRLANEPWLGSALDMIARLEDGLAGKGFGPHLVYFLGFSQGACLSLEFAARRAKRYGGVIAFTGGLIGEQLQPGDYRGDFAGTPVFIGSSDSDPHVPAGRVRETESIYRSLGAEIRVHIYPGMGHAVTEEEMNLVNAWMLTSAPDAR